MVANILKYGSINLVILYCCAYFGLWCYSARMWTDFRVRVSGQE